MADDRLLESEILVDSYGAGSALVALAELASPACRIEPQLLRRLRLACLPEADVSIEQELWQSELIDGRGKTITFRQGVARVLRGRLRARRQVQPHMVGQARTVMTAVHAQLSPLLILEDELAWAEVFQDDASIRDGARTLLTSLLARRDGLDYWLGRAWSALPAGLKQLPEGRQLAQVAAARGARIDQDPGAPTPVASVAHVLPLVPVPLKLHGLRLEVNARPSEATHVIDVPQTQPRAVSVASASGTEDVVFDVSETKAVHVAPGTVVIRTVTGSEYELEAFGSAAGSLEMEIELLPAGNSTSVLIRFDDGPRERQILVDCGNRATGRLLAERMKRSADAAESIDLLILTNITDGRIGGAIPLLEAETVYGRLRDVWFNTYEQMMRPRARS
jgi:hypothetical protein